MPTIGEQLRSARESKGLDIEEAHRQTKIHTRILRAMEEDRAADVLEPAYAKGFIKKYATFLSIDPRPLVDAFKQNEPPPIPASLSIEPRKTRNPGTPKAPSLFSKWLIPIVLGAVALIGVSFFAFLTKDLYRSVSHSSPAASKPAVAVKKTSVAAAPAASAPQKLIVPKSQPIQLTIQAKQDCWMQVKADDKVLFQNVLAKGKSETWTANNGIELWVGNAAVLSMNLNGNALESLPSGVMKGLKVTRYGLQLPKKPKT